VEIVVGQAVIKRAMELQLCDRPIAWLGARPHLISQHRHWLHPHFLDEQDCWGLDFQTWILEIEGQTIVVDPCTGNSRPHIMPQFDMLDIPFIDRFSSTGTRPEDVDFVFCTHFHHDHCGWNTQLKDGRWMPTFPNARYLFVQREYDRWNPNGTNYRAVDYNDGVYDRSIRPIVEAGLADFADGTYRVVQNVMIETAYGHTSGHSVLSLASSGHNAIFTGDAFHHPLQLIDPQIQFGDCDDIDSAIATRRSLAAAALKRDALLIPAHLPYPHAGRLQQINGELEFHAYSTF
jgi:glyoxylase-like metal-dependent hydrolase (beta-lactamase superfamily II)